MRLTGVTIGLGLALLGTAIAFHTIRASAPSVPRVTLLRTPHQGIQPETVLDANGVLHMIYFIGDVSAGDIEYVRPDPSGHGFSEPLRVNSEPGSAVAIGTVRGPQLSVGRNARAYVIWFGPQAKSGDPTATMPVFFSRLNDSGTAFEPQRNLMQYARGGDGGLSVASDLRGNVYSVWHAMGAEPGDGNRRVYLAHSADDGRTFRTATVASWEVNACPMSTAYLSEGGHRVLAAWEKAGEIYFEQINANSPAVSAPIGASGDASNRKHPALAANANGKVLMAWTEGTGWHKGGSLAWQLFDSAGKPLAAKGSLPGIPAWDLPAVFADRDGNFTVVY